MKRSTCDPQRLRRLLAGELTEQGESTLTHHLHGCETCQQQLESIAAEATWWQESQQMLADTVVDTNDGMSSEVLVMHEDDHIRGPGAVQWPGDFLEPPSHPELLGQLGRYQIESVVGHGGMGIVLKGFDVQLHRTVAVKVLSPHLAHSGTARQRFSREARAAAAVVHEHVVAIHGIETDAPLPYIVMPYIGGESLQRYVDRVGPLDVVDVVTIAMQIASGLAAAHEQGLVHRDIKPGNIMLENGLSRVLITDFGLARAADDASVTRSGLVAGTPHYMSPEQANGASIDGRSDLFSLGSVIYFMVTGRAPFRGDGAMAVLHSICHKECPSPREINPRVPEPLERMIGLLMRKPPHERLATASELRQLLADYLAYLQNPTQNSLPARLADHGPFYRHLQRHWIVASIATSCLGLVSVLGFGRSVGPSLDPVVTSPPSSRNIVQPLASDRSSYISDFDVAVQQLEIELTSTQSNWASESTVTAPNDSWHQTVQELSAQMDAIKTEWSEFP